MTVLIRDCPSCKASNNKIAPHTHYARPNDRTFVRCSVCGHTSTAVETKHEDGKMVDDKTRDIAIARWNVRS